MDQRLIQQVHYQKHVHVENNIHKGNQRQHWLLGLTA